MIVRTNELLNKHTTIRIGGIAEIYYIPETVRDLQNLLQDEKELYFIGGGSNLLIAEHEFEKVVDLGCFDTSIRNIGDGLYRVGASARLQQVINEINKDGYGGIEYLFSVPGLIGGAVVMNAGRGKKYGKSISDYVISVEVICEGEICSLTKAECKFGYRNSIFKNSNMIVVAVLLKFPKVLMEESKQLIKERIDLCQKKQDNSFPNFGTVFLESNPYIMTFAKIFRMRSGNCCFSGKTTNWLLNHNGSFQDALQVIKRVERLHIYFRKKCEREVIIWK